MRALCDSLISKMASIRTGSRSWPSQTRVPAVDRELWLRHGFRMVSDAPTTSTSSADTQHPSVWEVIAPSGWIYRAGAIDPSKGCWWKDGRPAILVSGPPRLGAVESSTGHAMDSPSATSLDLPSAVDSSSSSHSAEASVGTSASESVRAAGALAGTSASESIRVPAPALSLASGAAGVQVERTVPVTSHIHGSAGEHGMIHDWRRGLTNREGSGPASSRWTRYTCAACKCTFHHFYDLVPDIARAMAGQYVPDSCGPL